jgi:4-amino-4-deoxy-L-arabinose transferase-like glycosyltransferase
MELPITTRNKVIILLTPALMAFCIALIPTLKYQWPLTWDIYYHVHLAKLYLEHGFTLWDPLTYAPFGRPIYYPPLFHFLLAAASVLFKTDPFQIARSLQPIFAFGLVSSFAYIAYKFYDLRAGVLVGFLLLFSAVFHRAILPLPETMALILFPPAVYLYYQALGNKNIKYAVFAGILAGVMFLTHNLTAFILLGVLLIFTLAIKFQGEKADYKNLWIFLGVCLLVASLWWLPVLYMHGYVFNNPHSPVQTPLEYLMVLVKTIGIPAVILGLIGAYALIKKDTRNHWPRKDILIISWIAFLLVVSNAYLLGISILVDRILNFAVFPVLILAVLGLEFIRNRYDRKLYTFLVFLLIITAVLSGLFYATSVKPMVTSSQQEVAIWFSEHGDKEKVVMSITEGLDPVIASIGRQPVSTGGYQPGMVKVLDRDLYYSGTYTKEDVIRDNIGYFVEASPIQHPSYFTLVYENKDYKIWRVDLS